ncbi:MAG: stage II sporulation protein D [Firmicutes bacterium]|nr:stage II sporulation protein D [Bacillota bacterium]
MRRHFRKNNIRRNHIGIPHLRSFSLPHNTRYLAAYAGLVLFFLLVLPFVSMQLFPRLLEDAPKTVPDITLPDTVSIYITDEERTKKIPFEDYITGVVASEMPDSFEAEALKAQAIASRTYALGRINSGTQLCDTVHCQVYRDHDIPSKVRRAVKATAGQVLTYDGKLASQALYFSSSAGDTENAEDVFANPYPYLVSVSSSYEPGATHKKEKTTLTLKEFHKTIKEAFPDTDFGSIKTTNIKVTGRTKGGRVSEVQVGEAVLSGGDFRTAFDLYSTRFVIATRGSKITITTSGSGHGVGMSQYGANGLAKRGRNYRQILKHYYKGVDLTVGST